MVRVNEHRLAQIKRHFGITVSESTWKRWRRWWRIAFNKTRFWKQARSTFSYHWTSNPSLGVYLYETMRPRFKELVLNEDGSWVEVGAGVEFHVCDVASLVRFGGSLYFANVSYFEENILKLITKYKKLRYIIIDCIGINKVDASGMDTLYNLCARLEEAGVHLWFARAREPVFQIFKKSGFVDHLGADYFYKNNLLAMKSLMLALGKKHTHACHLIEKK